MVIIFRAFVTKGVTLAESYFRGGCCGGRFVLSILMTIQPRFLRLEM